MSAQRGFRAQLDEKALTDELRAVVVKTLRECGEDLKTRSERICPKKRGYNGGLVSTAEMSVDDATLTMRLKYTAKHAHIIHERKDYKHKPGEQAKFIEQPLDQHRDTYLKRIADAIGGHVR